MIPHDKYALGLTWVVVRGKKKREQLLGHAHGVKVEKTPPGLEAATLFGSVALLNDELQQLHKGKDRKSWEGDGRGVGGFIIALESEYMVDITRDDAKR